jgi:hypothetical protein
MLAPAREERKEPMSRSDRFKLLFGPYRPPHLCKGDRATCLYRGCEVIVTGWTDALRVSRLLNLAFERSGAEPHLPGSYPIGT